MDIRNINTFIRVAELQSFTQTALEMNYAQSTVTTQIQQLEKELGYPLFDRIGKKVSLTALGQEFLGYAYQVLQAMDKAKTLAEEGEDLCGNLRIGVSESLLFGVLMDLLPAFKEQYKNMDISLKTGHTTELLDALEHNKLDIIYISKSLNTDPNITCYYARKEELIFTCGTGHPLAGETKIPLSRIFENSFLVTEREGVCYGRLREIAAQSNATLLESVEVDSVFVIAQLVKQGVGLGFLPEYAVTKQLKEGTLVKLDADIPSQIYYSQILCHKSRWLSPFMAGFIDMIHQSRPQ